MKKHIALKIILMLIIFAITYSIKISSTQALTTRPWPGSWTGNASTLAQDPQVFCREFGGPLPYSGTFRYVGDGQSLGKKYNDQYAYIFNFLNKPGSLVSQNPAQIAFWSTPLGGGNGGNRAWEGGFNQYKNYNIAISRYRSNGYKPIVDTSNARYDAATRRYGPITITYPTWQNPMTDEKYGLSFSVKANGNTIYPKIEYKDNILYITFTQDQINSGITQATLKIHYSYLENCWSKITPIKAANQTSSNIRFLCEEHYNNSIKTFDEAYSNLTEGTFYIDSNDPDTIWLLDRIAYDELGLNNGIHGRFYYIPTGATNGHQDQYYIFRKFVCRNEITQVTMGQIHCGHFVNGNIMQKLVWVDFGKRVGNDDLPDIEIQLMPTINLNLAKYNSIVETKVDNTNQAGTPLEHAEFDVQAHQVGTDGTLYELTVKNINGVRKIIPASKKYLPTMGNEKLDDGEKFKSDYIYVLITETKAPNGYKKLNGPICIRYTLDYSSKDKRYEWQPRFRPTEEEWSHSGFTNFISWKWDKTTDKNNNIINKNDFEFRHLYYTDLGDNIVVEKIYIDSKGNRIENYEQGEREYIINVFDEAVVEKLKLLKVDADDNNSPLNGAKFTATFENVKEFYIGGNRISGDKPYTFIVDGSIEIQNVVYIDENKPIKIILEEVEVPTAKAGWYYKKLEGAVTIEIEHTQKNGLTNGTVSYTGTETINNGNLTISDYEATLTIPNIRLIDIDGLVWVDGTTGIKPVMSPNGVKDDTERNVSNVLVEIKGDSPRQFNNETATYINDNTTRTDNNGTYKFIGLRWNKEYFVTFNYDGIHYIASNAENYKGAQETAATRTTFNDGYKTINSDMELSYEYNKTANETYGIKERTSILETLSEKNAADKKYPVEMTDTRLEMGSIQDKFNMTASTTKTLYNRHGRNLNLGILKRGTDLALLTNVYTATVSINGQTTVFDYDDLKNQENIDLTKEDLINSSTSDEKLPDYSIYLRSTDYYYRMRKFESNPNFVVTDTEEPNNMQTGDELEVYVTYTLQLDNQANKFAKVKKIRYDYSPYYQFDTEVGRIYYLENGQEVELVKGTDYSVNSNNNIIDINKEIVFDVNSSDNYFGVRTFYIEFRVPDSTLDLLRDGNVKFENKAEIMEYETAEGLIDIDSQPGNYISKSQIEDDNDKANGITLGIKDEVRTISGFVWDDANKNGKFDEGEALVDDVIVQLIELKEKNGKYYEYIWQETLSGSKDVKRMATQKNKEGKFVIENYSHPDGIITTGGYKFEGFIPGDYIIRFIYGDGTTYDLTDNMIKYNGQDYKSTIEGKYTAKWYNIAEYETNVNITRDNESRRLETMSWSTNIDARKGILLKLLDGYTQEDFNLVEKEELFKALKDFKDELDAKLKEAQEDGDDDLEKEINAKLTALDNIGIPDSYTNLNSESIKYLLKNVTLDNTWMCAETAKIKVPVESENLKDVTTTVEVNGIVTNYKYDFSSMAFGLAKRPETKLKVEKHLKEMVLKASNGQTVLSAYINNNNELDGQIDGLQVITIPEGMPGHGEWIFSVSPVDINTILDGGRLEFSYNIVVKNIGDEDYLGATLRGEYNDANINYEETLKKHAKDVKTAIKSANTTYTLGTYLGQTYYMGGTDSANKVQTEVTGIRDYIANELVVFENGTKNLENIGEIDHYLYNDNYAITEKTKINNVLENQIPTGKLEPNNQYDEYVVNLGKDPLSSTSTLDFFNYIAEITSFSNAVGRRGTYTTVDEDGKLIGKSITPGNAEAVNKHIPDNGARLEPDESTVEEVHIQSALGQDKQATYIWLGIATISIAIIGAGVYVIKRRIMK